MTEAENKSITNLIALCQPHSFEVDQDPLPSVSLLRNWRSAQIAEYERIQKNWSLTDAEVQVVVDTSFHPQDYAVEFAVATSVTKVAKSAGLLVETARDVRRFPRSAASEWGAMRARVARSSLGIWDAETGESIHIQPSRIETAEHMAAMQAALDKAVAVVSPMVTDLVAELHALRAAAARLDSWCDWLESAAREVLAASSRWPMPSEEDDEVLREALDELSRSSSALSSRWQGRTAEHPPDPQPDPAEPAETEVERLVRSHAELLDAARPWSRVTNRPYEQPMYERLVEAAQIALQLPFVLSFLSVSLPATAGLAAAVARNSDDATLMTLIDSAAAEKDIAVAAHLLREFMFVARATERFHLEAHAVNKISDLLGRADWSSVDLWKRNRFHMVTLLNWTSSVNTDDVVRNQIAAALEAQPQLLKPIILAVSTQSELYDTEENPGWSRIDSRIADLPPWFPTDVVISQIHAQYPDLLPADIRPKLGADGEFTRLAQQLLQFV